MLLLALALSLAGLAVGPLLAALGRGRVVAVAAMEGLTLGLLPALLLVRHLPHVAEDIGAVPAITAMASGYVGLRLIERWRHVAGERVGRGLILTALAMHAFTDGAGLALAAAAAQHGSSEGVLLGVALLVHRMPEGLFLVTRFLPELGWTGTVIRLGLVGLATIVGAFAGDTALSSVPHELFDGFVAVGLGAMLAMALHTHTAVPAAASPSARRAGALAFLVGVVAAVSAPEPAEFLVEAHPRELSVLQSLGPLFVATAPSLLLGLLAAGLVHAFMPRQLTAWLRGGRPPSQALRGMVFGFPLPLCSCGVLPVTRRLLVAGIPTAAVIAFAVGAPELDVGSAILSLRLLGVPLTIARLVGSVALAMTIALLVAMAAGAARTEGPPGEPGEDPVSAVPPPPARHRLRAALADAVGPTLDHVAAWYVMGLVIAAIFEATVDPDLALGLPPPLDLITSALAAIPIYVCAQGATPLAAVMLHKGLSVGAVLAFLLVGPATNMAILALLRRHLGLRAAVTFALGSAACGVIIGLLANAFIPASSAPEVHALVARESTVVEWVAAAVLAVLLLASILRLGPRGWFATMLVERSEPVSGEHVHVHGHGCGHGHGHEHETTSVDASAVLSERAPQSATERRVEAGAGEAELSERAPASRRRLA
ncbi:permease [Chondromyces crocatus]|uniref:Permease n=1 Tax=Chondromyces crocatus TaxID=52 RepID=A0A0K1E5N8_CHOCO|nr:permease [Chondromyces crocatus]AKT36190.1 uncharacterized protein CMC5_003040 [Chondromyces crocatus]